MDKTLDGIADFYCYTFSNFNAGFGFGESNDHCTFVVAVEYVRSTFEDHCDILFQIQSSRPIYSYARFTGNSWKSFGIVKRKKRAGLAFE